MSLRFGVTASCIGVVWSLLACGDAPPYPCTTDDQCIAGDKPGVCASVGFCAFADSTCDGGYRIEPNAGQAAGTCLGKACGGVGQPCCAGEPACASGTCESGTCRSCLAAVRFGRRYGCVRKTNGTIWCAGDNTDGELAIGTVGGGSTTWVQVRDAAGPITDASALGVGKVHSCAVRSEGAVSCWGWAKDGQLGDGGAIGSLANSPLAVPVVQVNGTPLRGIEQVRLGTNHTCGLGSGKVWCWGNNDEGRLGDGTTTSRSRAAPVLESSLIVLSGATSVQAENDTSCVQKANGGVYCWGNNPYGLLGVDPGITPMYSYATSIGTWTTFELGRWALCRVDAASRISCTGRSMHRTFGNGTVGGSDSNKVNFVPVEVLARPAVPFTGASMMQLAGGGAACALMTDTSLYCWGNGHYGQTGTGQGEIYPAPVIDADGRPLTGVDLLVAEFPHVCVRKTSGEWLCWGRNTDGEFGDGEIDNRGVPTPLQISCP